MRDLYEVLGVSQTATTREIIRAYRAHAVTAHPDRGGDHERMQMLNDAYAILSDPNQRERYHENMRARQAADTEESSAAAFSGVLQAGNIVAFSEKFRKEHSDLVTQYRQVPLERNNMHADRFASGLYSFQERNGTVKKYHDIFTLIRAKSENDAQTRSSRPTEGLTPISAIKILADFLSGQYYGQKLIVMHGYLVSEIVRLSRNQPSVSEFALYHAVDAIITMGQSEEEQKNLIFYIKKITDYAKNAPDILLPHIIPLFYNKFFRNLYAFALHLYWHSQEDLFTSETVRQFDGLQEARELLSVLRDRLSNDDENEGLANLIQQIRLLYNFEKDTHESRAREKTADEHRESAFHLLDWMTIFIGQGHKQMLLNVFLQIGIAFQQASQLETQPAVKMADERLALKMYLTAYSIGDNATPDLKNYAATHVLKYISAFAFQDEMLNQVIPALKKSVLILSDVFPFFENLQSNVYFLRRGNETLHLMRRLLNVLVNIHEYNKTHEDRTPIDHSAATILYQAYEACLKNWYQEHYDPATEQKFRVGLMNVLLAEKSWTFENINHNVGSPWIMVDRDEQGWMKPTRSLPLPEEPALMKYRDISGMEVNHKTGEINFFMTAWTQDRSPHEQVFSLFDLQEMLEKNIGRALFSLDPVDPDKPYHPFNVMRFGPPQLHNSELLNTMLLTDYILKFLTTNQEVQGQHPFDQRSVATMIQHLPEHLRKIIDDFHASQHSGALHRFWIEAEEIEVVIDKEQAENGVTRMGLGELKMFVKKHRMERDMHGELKDVGNEDEGWPIYVLTLEQMQALIRRQRSIESHAMIFIHGETKLVYWENNKITKEHSPENFSETLIRLYKHPREHDGKIKLNSGNMSLLYRATKTMAAQANLSHRYSAEFIFAHEFTTHYNEFSQYLPEFGRLKELSKITVLIRTLNGIRESNRAKQQAVDFILSPASNATAPDTEVYREYKNGYDRVCQNITSAFKAWRNDVSTSALQRKILENLRQIKNEISPLTFDEYSSEVDAQRNHWYADISRKNPRASSSQIWDAIPSRLKTARDLSENKQTSVRKQLREIFSDCSSSSIASFMQGNNQPLTNELVSQQKTKAQQEIHKQFPRNILRDIAAAMDDNGDATALRIATAEARYQLEEQKINITKLESGFVSIHLGTQNESVDLAGKCFWVPASVRHEPPTENSRGLSRHSFFVYGGVNVQPRQTVLYQMVGPNGEHLKYGVTVNPATRYSQAQLDAHMKGAKLVRLAQGNRKDILQFERLLHATLPIGSSEKQQYYQNAQAFWLRHQGAAMMGGLANRAAEFVRTYNNLQNPAAKK